MATPNWYDNPNPVVLGYGDDGQGNLTPDYGDIFKYLRGSSDPEAGTSTPDNQAAMDAFKNLSVLPNLTNMRRDPLTNHWIGELNGQQVNWGMPGANAEEWSPTGDGQARAMSTQGDTRFAQIAGRTEDGRLVFGSPIKSQAPPAATRNSFYEFLGDVAPSFLAAFAGPQIAGALGSAIPGLSSGAAAAGTGAILGGGSAALRGGDIGRGALMGGATAAIGNGLFGASGGNALAGNDLSALDYPTLTGAEAQAYGAPITNSVSNYGPMNTDYRQAVAGTSSSYADGLGTGLKTTGFDPANLGITNPNPATDLGAGLNAGGSAGLAGMGGGVGLTGGTLGIGAGGNNVLPGFDISKPETWGGTIPGGMAVDAAATGTGMGSTVWGDILKGVGTAATTVGSGIAKAFDSNPLGTIAGGIGIAGSLFGDKGLLTGDSKSAADAATDAADMADPFRSYRAGYAEQLSKLMANPSLAMGTPGYQFARLAGQQGLERAGAKLGQNDSGNRAIALNNYNQNYALSSLDNQIKTLAGLSGATQNPANASSAYLAAQNAQAASDQNMWKSLGQGLGALGTGIQGLRGPAPSPASPTLSYSDQLAMLFNNQNRQAPSGFNGFSGIPTLGDFTEGWV